MVATLAAWTLLLQAAPDPRLAVKIGLADKIVPIKDLCRQLQAQTQVPFAADKAIRDRKITLFVHDRPASEVMWAIESALFLKFDPYRDQGQDGYRVVQPDRIRVEEREAISDENDAIRTAMLSNLGRLSGLATKSMRDLDLEATDLLATMRQVARLTDPKSRATLQAAEARQQEMEGYRAAGLAQILAKDGDAIADSLLGDRDEPSFAMRNFNPQLAPMMPGEKGGIVPTAAFGAAWYDPNLRRLKMYILSFHDGDPGTSASGTGPPGWPTTLDIDLKPGPRDPRPKSKLVQRLADWGQPLDPSILKIALPKPEPGPPSPYRGKAYSLADHIEHLAKSADIPVVADAFRLAASAEKFYAAKTVGEYVEALKRGAQGPAPLARVGTARTENGWLMLRHDEFWSKQLAEVPEDLIAPLEAKVKDQQIPTIDDYADFAAHLTGRQAAAFQATNAILMRCPRIALLSIRALRLWSQLSGPERDLARKDALIAGQLDQKTAGVLAECAFESMIDSNASQAEIGAVLSRNRGLRLSFEEHMEEDDFHMLDTEQVIVFGSPMPEMVRQADQAIFSYKFGNDLLGMNVATILRKPPKP